MNELAIVIPAYKNTYFNEALNSLALQTNKDFTVYIGDDCSPFDLKSIINKYENILDIKYTRFEKNIGSKNLVDQWKRCIELSEGEKWLWLFSDDDILDKGCVENFFETLKAYGDKYDVYRFNTCIINNEGKFLGQTPIGPMEESSEEMAYNLLLNRRGNSMPDHIFSRRVYEDNSGFVHTLYAQGADWATSILFSKQKGIAIIPEAKVNWRLSGSNISSIAYREKDKMIQGYLQFITWIIHHFDYLKTSQASISHSMIIEAARVNLVYILINHYKGFKYSCLPEIISVMRKDLNMTYFMILKAIIKIKKATKHSISLNSYS